MPSRSEWESQKDVIRELYLNQKYTLKELQDRMKSAGFTATKSQYETKFKAWGFSKNGSNVPAATWKHVGYKMAKRKRDNEDSAVFIDGAEVDSKRVKKEISRHKYSTVEQIELENIGAPSPPGPLVMVTTPPSSQAAFSINLWPDNLPWLVFVRSLNIRLASLHKVNQNSWASHAELSELQSRAQNVVLSPDHSISALRDWQKSRHITTRRERWDLIHTMLPSSTSWLFTTIQHNMSLLSTTSSHWALKLLIYMISNKFLGTGDLGRVWHLVEELGVRELATLSQSLQLGEASLQAALEYLFEASVRVYRTDIVLRLLDIGMDPNRRIMTYIAYRSHLPLCVAMDHEDWTHVKPMVRLLLSQGASPLMECCKKHTTAAFLALTNPKVDAETLEMVSQAVMHVQSLEQSTQYFKDLRREHETNSKKAEAQQHQYEIFLKMELLVGLLEKSSTSSETLISRGTLIQAVMSNNHRLIRIIHERGLSMNCHVSTSAVVHHPCSSAQSALAIAAKKGGPKGTSTVNLLLKLGASPNYNPYPKNNHLCSHALHFAIHTGDTSHRLGLVQILIENGAKTQGSVSSFDEDRRSLMHCALKIQSIDADVLAALHDAGLPFPRDSLLHYLDHNYYYLHPDSSRTMPESVEVIQLLISKTSDWTLQSEKGWTALDYMAETEMNEVEDLMIKKGAVHSRKFIHDYCLCREVHIDRLETLFKRIPIPRSTKQKRTWLFYRIIATLGTEHPCSNRLVASPVRDLIHDYSKLPRSPEHEAYIIFRACITRDVTIIDFTLKYFPDTNSPDALIELIGYSTDRTNDYWHSIKELLKRHSNNPSSLQWRKEKRIFSRAVYTETIGKGDSRVLEWFRENRREAFELTNLHPSSFLMECLYTDSDPKLENDAIAFMSRNFGDCWKSLDTCERCKYGLKASTYLGLLVARYGEAGQMRDLLHHGLQPNRRFSWALTILQSAVAEGDISMSRQLLDAGADVNAPAPWMAMPFPWSHDFTDPVVETCESGIGTGYGRNALQLAVERGNLEMIELLLEFGANVNEPPAPLQGATALQIACIQGYIDIARLLLQKGADVNAARAQHSGRTALEGAAEHGRLDMACFLLENGCQTHGSFRTQYIRAVGFARRGAHHTMGLFLQDHGDWTAANENALNDADLTDSEGEGHIPEDMSQEDEGLSELTLDFLESDGDSSASDGDSQFAFLSKLSKECDFGDDDSARDDAQAPTFEEEISSRFVEKCGNMKTGLEPATLKLDTWDELIEYDGDDEGV